MTLLNSFTSMTLSKNEIQSACQHVNRKYLSFRLMNGSKIISSTFITCLNVASLAITFSEKTWNKYKGELMKKLCRMIETNVRWIILLFVTMQSVSLHYLVTKLWLHMGPKVYLTLFNSVGMEHHWSISKWDYKVVNER